MDKQDSLGTREDMIVYCMEKAYGDLEDAFDLYRKGVKENKPTSIDNAASRSYYGIFSAICAVHVLHGTAFKKHRDAIGQFNKLYVHEGVFPKEYGRRITHAERCRNTAEYNFIAHAKREDVKKSIRFAREFVPKVASYLLEKTGMERPKGCTGFENDR